MQYFDNVYISDGVKTALSTHELENILLIACVRPGQIFNQRPSNIHDGTSEKKTVNNVNLKTPTILAKD